MKTSGKKESNKKYYIMCGSLLYLYDILKWLTLSEMTHFRLFQIERVCRRQFQIW